MKKRNCVVFALSIMISTLSCISCSDDNEDYIPRIYPKATEKYSVGVIYHYTLEEDGGAWSVSSDNEDVVKIEIDKGVLSVIPQKIGHATIVGINGKNETVFTSAAEITKGEQTYEVVQLFSKVMVINDDYKTMIENEIAADQLLPVGTIYTLIYPEVDKGDLFILPGGSEAGKISGTFRKGDEGIFVFSYNGKEETYVQYLEADRIKENTVNWFFVKDYTMYFREKYPEAGVYKAEGYQEVDHFW